MSETPGIPMLPGRAVGPGSAAEALNQPTHVTDREGDVLLRQGAVPGDADGVIVVDHAVVAYLVEGPDDLCHRDVAVVHEDLLVATRLRQRAPDVAEVDVEQLPLVAE